MGVNRAGFTIVDDEAARRAAEQEIIRRSLRYECEYMMGMVDKDTVQRANLLMNELGVKIEDRPVVLPARKAAEQGKRENKGNNGIFCGAAIQLKDGAIITGKNSLVLHSPASAVLNAIKHLAEIPDKIHLITPNIIHSIANMKKDILKGKSVSLDLEEALIALSTSTPANSAAQLGMEQLKYLKGCEMHTTHIPTPGDEAGMRMLGINLTSDPFFASESLFIR